MASAADYLQLSTGQITTNYKLRSLAAVPSQQLIATNSSPDIILSVEFVPPEGVTVTPNSLTLQPNTQTSVIVTVTTNYLETLPAGTSIKNITANVSGVAIAQNIQVTVTPASSIFDTANQTRQFTPKLTVNNVDVAAVFDWALGDSTTFTIGTTGAVTATLSKNNITNVIATVRTPVEYTGYSGTATANFIQTVTASPASPTSPAGPTGIVTPPPTASPTVTISSQNQIFTQKNQSQEYTAILLDANGTRVQNATFAWSLDSPNVGFVIGDTGNVTAREDGRYMAGVRARVTDPVEYRNLIASITAAANIGIQPPKGKLRINITGLPSNVEGDVVVNNQKITKSTTLELEQGSYSITPNSINFNGLYTARARTDQQDGFTNVISNTTTSITVYYTKQIVDQYILSWKVLPNPSYLSGRQITVIATTTNEAGNSVEIGPINFVTTNGMAITNTSPTPGVYTATFTAPNQSGIMTITASSDKAGTISANTTIISESLPDIYTINFITVPSTLISGDTATVIAVVLKNGASTDIPIAFSTEGAGQIGGGGGGGSGGGGGGGGGGSEGNTDMTQLYLA